MLGSLHSLQRGPEKEGLTKRVSFGGRVEGCCGLTKTQTRQVLTQDPGKQGHQRNSKGICKFHVTIWKNHILFYGIAFILF